MHLYTLKKRMFEGINRAHYKHFEGHIFKNASLHSDGHILLDCVDDPALTINQFVHVDDLDVVEVTEAERK